MPSVTTNSTKQALSNGPASQPADGTKKPDLLSTSTRMPLNTSKPIPVAQFGARATGGGEKLNTNSTMLPLSRTANSPYESRKLSETTPQVNYGKGKKR